ncbi:TetR/AcrR family transcriptional regulator [Ureibacillus chungkukjangi]|uniref:TetR family transcriptional regulator n=1 Tax=Ureibacillus chungkukjangi TaxID=1202712 RepID=A0A318TF52_9BACL|nr:TetR/AcrR family transcriptional regulator [Ureibacillus chungkukjangi]MCM3390361.1 TetR/AcrR family transcriptional regulator [Ureibacillus chungkukjangi]PYF02457.1 TetR family transcriptional regulator [Ureibacillus chungkukjangi]
MARERKFSTDDLYRATKQLLLQNGYEGFSFSLLAEDLDISRGAIYKYFDNREELIINFMKYEMNIFLEELKQIERYDSFEGKLTYLMDLIFKNSTIPQLIEIGQRIPLNEKVKKGIFELENLHLVMYKYLQGFIEQGRKEQRFRDSVPDPLILGVIFQSILIPNHHGISQSEWVRSIKEVLCYGFLK